MAANEELPMPDCAIFADTHWEPRAVYDHLRWLESVLPFPVHRVSAGPILEHIATDSFDPVPWYVADGIGRRQCTKQFKLYPIRKLVRSMLGGKTPAGGCEMWLGITTDEAHRMKPSNVQYVSNRWPLIEFGMSRADCRAKLARWGVDAPRSACCGCPFLSDEDWRTRSTQPEWDDTVALSHRLAATGQFMHRSLRTVDRIDMAAGQRDLFAAECEGLCGV